MSWIWPRIWSHEQGGGWRFLLTLGIYAGSVVLGILVYTAVMIGGLREVANRQPGYIQEVVGLAGTVVIAGLGLVGLLVGVRVVHRNPMRCVFTDGRAFGFGIAVQSAVVWGMLWFCGAVLMPGGWTLLAERGRAVPGFWWPVLVVAVFGAMVVGRTAEEVLFRGYLQVRVAAWTKRPWVAVCISSLVFMLLHRGNLAAYTAIALFGVAFGCACVRAGTLAPMIGAHTTHDALEVLWHPSRGIQETNAGATWFDVAWVMGALFIWFGWLLWATRGRHAVGGVRDEGRA